MEQEELEEQKVKTRTELLEELLLLVAMLAPPVVREDGTPREEPEELKAGKAGPSAVVDMADAAAEAAAEDLRLVRLLDTTEETAVTAVRLTVTATLAEAAEEVGLRRPETGLHRRISIPTSEQVERAEAGPEMEPTQLATRREATEV